MAAAVSIQQANTGYLLRSSFLDQSSVCDTHASQREKCVYVDWSTYFRPKVKTSHCRPLSVQICAVKKMLSFTLFIQTVAEKNSTVFLYLYSVCLLKPGNVGNIFCFLELWFPTFYLFNLIQSAHMYTTRYFKACFLINKLDTAYNNMINFQWFQI